MTGVRCPRLAGVAEIAALAGVSRQRASSLSKSAGFPEPVQDLSMGPVWIEDEVKAFLEIPRKPGRRPKVGGTKDG